jgi:5-methylcytosine-specific restriction endonuclease McrA
VKRSELRPDPEKVRAWQQRSRERAQRQRKPAKKKASIPRAVRAEVRTRTANRCAVCITVLASRPRRIAHLHHLFPEAEYPHLAKEPANLIGLCAECHSDYHFGGVNPRRIPREALPRATFELACREGLGWFIERTYP